MKKIIIVIVLLFSLIGQAQFDAFVPKPNDVNVSTDSNVKWTTSVEQLSEKKYKIFFNVSIASGYHLYSQFLPKDSAFPTSFVFDGNGVNYQLIGKTEEIGTVAKIDPFFEVEMPFFSTSGQFIQVIELLDTTQSQINVSIEYQTCNDTKCILGSDELSIALNGDQIITSEKKAVDAVSLAKSVALKLDLKKNVFLDDTVIKLAKSTHWDLFFLGFLGGLIALLTPCVFPMIPLTVSFFTKHTGDRKKGIFNAILYGLFIVVIYVLISVPFHVFESLDSEVLNNISTNVVLNVLFFIIISLFAFSFFGYYEITLPNKWSNKMDSASNVGGIVGIFFMAVTLSIVSFSCTGPILGSLLAGSLSADGGAMQLTMGMSGFGLALALPFALFALFPNLLNSLPKSGGWMTTVKVVLGFLELALALKFLSNADLVSHWGLLKRELFIGIWMLLFSGLALYLFGKIKFPHDPPHPKISNARKLIGITSLVFVMYLLPGLTNTKYANLKLISGFLPPMFYSYYEQKSACPLGLACYKDFDEGLAEAKRQNKPILLDFTGWACVNCRRMEEKVWSDPKIYQLINEEYILISLYVDDRKELPVDEQFEFEKPNGKIKSIKTIGDKWSTFQIQNFNITSQPYYVLLSPDLEMLNKPKGAVAINVYHQWLQDGLKQKKKDN